MRDLLFVVLLLLFSCGGVLLPDLFAGFRGLVVPLLVVIMLSMGITLTPADFVRILRRPWIILLGALLQFSVMPLSGFLLALLFDLNLPLTVGLSLWGQHPEAQPPIWLPTSPEVICPTPYR